MRLPTRREFCGAALAGFTLVHLPACSDGGGGEDDAGSASDLAGDLVQKSCPPDGMVTAGLASDVAVNQAMLYTDNATYAVFLCRDAVGLFALNALCTHLGCVVSFIASNPPRFNCPCHGSRFAWDGHVTLGPARLPLDHYAVCVDSAGNVFIDSNTVVDPTWRA
jgi:cytochrome b6-f complex iron-sulfur subunit